MNESPKELLIKKGKVSNLSTYPPRSPGNDPMFTFDIGQEHFSGFKEPPFLEGDTISFEFKKSGSYNNFVRILEVSDTSLEPRPADQMAKETFKFTQKPTDSYLTKKMFSDLLCCSVRFKIAQNDLNEEAIYSLFERLLKKVGLTEEYLAYTQLNKGGKK